ncbi:putative membrane protein [Planomicrobium soli]|uniref:Putative membrane protein n=1 Tax=Planomicrobium soli TaxID=1176648 RepID=A0A2P8H6F6_9BACL|nr:DUF2207 domain-containing protein [Planomicrobium soli]PSL41796.1 putative membrane protein [Planomicrobium soli]
MEWKHLISVLLAGILVLLPTQALAVDYEISKTTIEARLTKDGNVNVTEWHTYDFDGEFNGITRELQPKQNASIYGFTAFESGNRLNVEQEGNLYKVYRNGKDETLILELQYKIKDGVEKFQDGTEFYWPFFDDRNESDYGNMTITVFPPALAEDVTYIGYDSAYKKGSLQDGGAVTFKMGKVPAEENGDIRVVFDSHLFPNITAQTGTIRDKVENEKQRLAVEDATFMANRQTATDAGSIAMAILGAIIAALIGGTWLQARQVKKANIASSEGFVVPQEKMSLPALLFFTKPSNHPANVLAAALMDLVRKGKVAQIADDRFELVDRHTDFLHENILINLLFDKVGGGNFFQTEDLFAYTKNEVTADTYQEALASWNQAVANELKQQVFYRQKKTLRWFTAFLGTASIAATIVFGYYGLILLMIISILFGLAFFSFAFFYKPLTPEGHKVREQWRKLENDLENFPKEEWDRLTKDEKFRAYSYLLGAEPIKSDKKAQAFARAETHFQQTAGNASTFNPVLLSAAFVVAHSNSAAHASSSSSASFGGGVGGGGGGSGAF